MSAARIPDSGAIRRIVHIECIDGGEDAHQSAKGAQTMTNIQAVTAAELLAALIEMCKLHAGKDWETVPLCDRFGQAFIAARLIIAKAGGRAA